jgi:hypothetical protein
MNEDDELQQQTEIGRHLRSLWNLSIACCAVCLGQLVLDSWIAYVPGEVFRGVCMIAIVCWAVVLCRCIRRVQFLYNTPQQQNADRATELPS